MKSIDTYTAAVFRRSQEKIAARRKRRRRLLAGAVPLCLALCLVLTMPLWRPVTTDGTPPANGQEFGTVGTSAVLTVTDEAGDFTVTVTDPDDVAHVRSLLTQYLTSPTEPESAADGNGGASPRVYTVRFASPQGDDVYYLFPDSRTLSGEGYYATLSEAQWQQFQTLFHLPD